MGSLEGSAWEVVLDPEPSSMVQLCITVQAALPSSHVLPSGLMLTCVTQATWGRVCCTPGAWPSESYNSP